MRNLEDYILKNDGTKTNFQYKEFVRSSNAQRFDIYNIPTSEKIWNNIENLVKYVLQPVRDKFGPIRINSGYRSLELNIKIGGSSRSNHVYGFAADIEPFNPNINFYDIVEFIHNTLEYKELILEFFPDGWIHVAYQEDNNKKDFKLKDKDHNYERVNLEYIKQLYGV